MTFVKDKSYREMPCSSEIPNEDYHQFLSLKKLIAKVTKHQHTVFQCRSIGVLHSSGQVYTLHDLDDSSIEIRVSLLYMRTSLPFAARPLTAQVFGFVHWYSGPGPVLYACNVKDILPPVAQKLARAMEWVVNNHRALSQGGDKNRPQQATVTKVDATTQTLDEENVQVREPNPLRENLHMARDQMAQELIINIRMDVVGPVQANQTTHEHTEATCTRCETDRMEGMRTSTRATNHVNAGFGRFTGTDQMVPSSQTSNVPMRIGDMAGVQNWPVDQMEAAHVWETVPVIRAYEPYVSNYPTRQSATAQVMNYPTAFYSEQHSHNAFVDRPLTNYRRGAVENFSRDDFDSNSGHSERASQFLYSLEQNVNYLEPNHYGFANRAQRLRSDTTNMYQQPTVFNEASHSAPYAYYHPIEQPFRTAHVNSNRRVSHTVVSDSEQPRNFGFFGDGANGRPGFYSQHEPAYATNDVTGMCAYDRSPRVDESSYMIPAHSRDAGQWNNREFVNRQSDVSAGYGQPDQRLGQCFEEGFRVGWFQSRHATSTDDVAAAAELFKRRFTAEVDVNEQNSKRARGMDSSLREE